MPQKNTTLSFTVWTKRVFLPSKIRSHCRAKRTKAGRSCSYLGTCKNFITVYSVSACGNYIPPDITYPRKRMSPQLQRLVQWDPFFVLNMTGLLKICSLSGFFISHNFSKFQTFSPFPLKLSI